jgi:hypothetical protein
MMPVSERIFSHAKWRKSDTVAGCVQFLKNEQESHARRLYTLPIRERRNAMMPHLHLECGDPLQMVNNNLRRTEDYISVCGWCGKILVGNDWLGVGEAIGKLQLLDLSLLPRLTHGLCCSCRVDMEKEIEDFKVRHNDTMGR